MSFWNHNKKATIKHTWVANEKSDRVKKKAPLEIMFASGYDRMQHAVEPITATVEPVPMVDAVQKTDKPVPQEEVRQEINSDAIASRSQDSLVSNTISTKNIQVRDTSLSALMKNAQQYKGALDKRNEEIKKRKREQKQRYGW